MALPGGVDIVFTARTDQFINGVRNVRGELTKLDRDARTMDLSTRSEAGARSLQTFSKTAQRAQVDVKGLTLSMVGLGTTMIGIFAASSRLDFAANRLEKTQVAVKRINDQIASTQKNLNRLMEQGKTNTEDYTVQVGRLTTAFADLKTKEEDVNLAQTALNDTQLLFATTIVNTGINSIFLMRSAFTGLSLSQIKATITGTAHSVQMGAASGAMGSFAVSTGFATTALLRFRTALLTAAPPLLIVAAAFAAYEGIIAPYIEKQTGANASLLKWVSAQFEAKDAMEKTNPALQKFKDALGETTEEQENLNKATKGFTELSTPVSTAVQTQIEGLTKLQNAIGTTTADWIVYERTINSISRSVGLQPGFSSPLTTGASISKLSPQSTFARLSGQTGGVIAGSGGTPTGISISGPSTQFPSTTSSVMTSVAKNNSQEITEALAISIFTGRKFDPNLSLVENAREMKARLPHLEAQLRRDLKSINQQIATTNDPFLRGLSGGTPTFKIIEATVVEKIAELLNTRVGIIEQKGGLTKVVLKNIISGGTPQVPEGFLGKLAFLSNPAAFKSREIFNVGTQIGTIGFPKESNSFFESATSIGEVKAQMSKLPIGVQRIFGELLKAKLTGDLITATELTALLKQKLKNIDPATGLPIIITNGKSSDIVRPKLTSDANFFGTTSAELLKNAVEKKKQAESFFIDAANFRKLAFTSVTITGRKQQDKRAQTAFEKGIKLAREGESLAKLGSLMDFSFGTGFGGIGGQAIRSFQSKGVSFGQGSLAFRALGLSQLVEQGISGAAVPVPGRINVDFREFADPIGTISEQQIAAIAELNRSRAADNTNFLLTALGRGDAKIGIDGKVSFSEQAGGAVRFSSRNKLVLRSLRAAASRRDAITNSIIGARRIQLQAITGGANNLIRLFQGGRVSDIGVLGRSQSNAIQRFGGISQQEAEQLRFDILATFALQQQNAELTQVAFGQQSPSERFGDEGLRSINAATQAFLNQTGAIARTSGQRLRFSQRSFFLRATQHIRAANARATISRLGIFVERALRGEPITLAGAESFATTILGGDVLAKSLATLGTSVETEFFKDNIDSRNEVLQFEAKAYFIDREEAASLA